MNFDAIKKALTALAPAAATLLGGPAAGAITAQIASALTGNPEASEAEILAGLASPDAAVKIKEIESNAKVELARIDKEKMALGVENAGQVNATMQSEAASQHWPTYSWRPAIGFAVAFNIAFTSVVVGCAFAFVILGLEGTEAQMDARTDSLQHIPAMIGAMAALIATVSPILGIASWFRGRMQADPNVPSDNRG